MKKNAKEKSRTMAELLADKRGAGLVEYVILVGCVAILCIAVFNTFGNTIKDKITGQTTTIGSVPTAGAK